MSINILHLTTGEQVIAGLEELKDTEGNPLCFVATMPMAMRVIATDDPENPSMNFFAWSPFSSTREFRIGFENIVAVAEPTWHVYDTYIGLVQPLHPVLNEEEFEAYKLEKKRRNKNND